MLKCCYFLVFWLFINASYAADMVVLRSNAPQFTTGQVLGQQTTIQLTSQQYLTVVFGSGQVRTASAPFDGQLSDPLPHLASPQHVTQLAVALQKVVYETRARRSPPDQPDDIWAVNVLNTDRHYCVAATQPVILWRPSQESQRASRVYIKHKASGDATKIMWPAKQTKLRWPHDFPVLYGDTYTLENKNFRGYASFKKLVLHELPNNLPSMSHKIVWMVGRGCIPQANMLMARLK